MIRAVVGLLAFLAVGAALFAGAFWAVENVRWEEPACPRGVGHGFQDLRWLEDGGPGPDATPVERLLDRPSFGATSEAAGDLRGGVVDERLVQALLTVTGEHSVCVQVFKEGHYFLPGVEDGPVIPDGYGEAGGLTNTHYFGRAADVRWIDGRPVGGNGTDPAVLGVGRALAAIPPEERPDQIIGPRDWTARLGYSWEHGWITAEDQLDLHDRHIHIGYRDEEGTNNTR